MPANSDLKRTDRASPGASPLADRRRSRITARSNASPLRMEQQ